MKADLILLNGVVSTQTQDAASEAGPPPTALAVSGGRILALGNTNSVRHLAGAHTEVLDLAGRLVLPGFIDSHIHFRAWSLGLARLDLAQARSFTGFLEQVAQAAAAQPSGNWIQGQGWNEAEWPENRQPTRHDLDRVAPHHPVLLMRCDLHMAVANSAALHLAGIDASSSDPPEGIIVRDAHGQPNGLLREAAIEQVSQVLPPVSNTDLLKAYRRGQQVAHSFGITGICDVPLMHDASGAAQMLRTWQILGEQNEAHLRVWAALSGESLDQALALGLRSGAGGSRLRIGPVKYFADGGMGARTAWLHEPYRDSDSGMPLMDMQELAEQMARAHAGGLAVMVHAIGDRANHEVIDILEGILYQPCEYAPGLPHRIEHVQMIRPSDVRRLGRLNVVASVQPPNLIIDINMIDECLGARGRYTYPFRDLLGAGVPVTFSSDAPVCDHNPLIGIHAAVNRTRTNGTPAGGWYTDQTLSVDEAVRAYTLQASAALGRPGETGCLAAGARADMVVLDQNIYTAPPGEIHRAQVDVTIFDGQVVYRRVQ